MSVNYLKSKNLTLGYGNDIVINNLHLSLMSDENYQIIGRNGVGKSTLLDFISNNFQGNIFKSTVVNVQMRILEISSQATINGNLTLKENCIYFTKEKIPERKMLSILEKYGMHNFLDDLVQNFSSGMIKRSEMAIADLINPEILCIDEPLNYLDKDGIVLLQNLMISRSKANRSNIISSQEFLKIFENNFEMIDLNV